MLNIFYILSFILLFNTNSFSQYRYKTSGKDSTKYSESSPDISIFRSFNNIESRFIHSVVNVTNRSIIPVSIAAPVGLYSFAKINGNHYDESSAVLLALSEITNLSVTQFLKITIQRPRPFRKMNNVYLTDTSDIAGTYSFPSGHSSQSFTIATLLTLRYPDKPGLIAGLYTYAAVVSLGRIYWGVHYPSDVFAGMLIGAGSAALIYSLRKPIINAKNDLFNQSERTDSYNPGIAPASFFITLAAADLLNHFLKKSDNSILSKSSINFDIKSDFGMLNYKIGF